MYAPERHQEILGRARAEGRVEVTGLAGVLAVTPETIRRDLSVLERQGLLRRVHGGAIPVERLGFEPGIADREALLAAEKERIARRALAELPAGGTVMLDAGTTTVRLAELLPTDRDLVVVTNSLPIATVLATRPNVVLHFVGGTVRGRTLASVGSWAERALADVQADVCFLGANGVTPDRGLTTPDLGEAAVKRALVAASRRVVVLADHTKIGRSYFARIVDLAAVDLLITDEGIDAGLREQLRDAGLAVTLA
ncbi:MAG: DeoR/GlpR family DNA-binding transcription regulator [Cellulomonadaceae bacterium]